MIADALLLVFPFAAFLALVWLGDRARAARSLADSADELAARRGRR
jgi:hypothetical protein